MPKRKTYHGPERRENRSFHLTARIRSFKRDPSNYTIFPHFESLAKRVDESGLRIIPPAGMSRRRGDWRVLKQWLRKNKIRMTKKGLLKKGKEPLTSTEIFKLAGEPVDLPDPVYPRPKKKKK